MIQIIKKDYKNISEAVNDINAISIQYDYFKDFNIMTSPTHENYTAILKFDVPKNYNCLATLDLAKIKAEGSFHILNFKYKIKFVDKELEANSFFKCIECEVYNNKIIKIYAHFGFKDFIELIRFNYLDDGLFENKYIQVYLKEFEFSPYLSGVRTIDRETFICENIDYKYIYDHIVNVYLQRGYLLDIDGLNDFKKVLKRACNLINERNVNPGAIDCKAK